MAPCTSFNGKILCAEPNPVALNDWLLPYTQSRLAITIHLSRPTAVFKIISSAVAHFSLNRHIFSAAKAE